MRAIPTYYGLHLFRSRMEAQWAEFFDDAGIRWQYEPEGYTNGSVHYLPDFWLPQVYSRAKSRGVFFEVKPSSPTAPEMDKAIMLASGSGRPVILASRSPHHPDREELVEVVRNATGGWDDEGLVFALCEGCGAADIGFYFSDEPACPCGTGRFSPFHTKLSHARAAFPTYSRWERAA